MKVLEVNETPIRTSKNFNINNMKFENIEIPETKKKFESMYMTGAKHINEDFEIIEKLKYGNGKILEENVINSANSKIKLHIENNENINIVYDFNNENLNLVNYIEIKVSENTKANVVIKYKSSTNKQCFNNGILEITAKEKSDINITLINLLNEESNYFEAIESTTYENANINFTIIDIGGKNSSINYYSNMIGDMAKNNLKTIYLGRNNQVKDSNYIAELKGLKSNLNIDVQGALNDNAKKHFKGTIDFKKGCKKSVGNESEYCMLLSNSAKSISLPVLLCTEDDVEGNHGVASGKIDSKELFYIMSRGIPYKDAIKLIVKARFNKIIDEIEDEKTRNEVLEEIDRRLD